MGLGTLPPEILNAILTWLPPLSRIRFSLTCKSYWNLLTEDRELYSVYHDVFFVNAWQAILDDQMKYIDEISAGERWEKPSYIPSWEEFSNLHIPQDWLEWDLESDLEQRKFMPVLAYLITKTPFLEKLEFDYQDNLGYLVNVLPRLDCQLTSIRIKRHYEPATYEIDIHLIHAFLDNPTLKDLFVEGFQGEDYSAPPPPPNETSLALEHSHLSVYDVTQFQFLHRLPNLQSIYYCDQLSIPGRRILQHLPKSIKSIHLESDSRNNNERVEWNRFECLETILTTWDDIDWEELPNTLRNVYLTGVDTAGRERIAATSWISRFPRLKKLNINGMDLFPA